MAAAANAPSLCAARWPTRIRILSRRRICEQCSERAESGRLRDEVRRAVSDCPALVCGRKASWTIPSCRAKQLHVDVVTALDVFQDDLVAGFFRHAGEILFDR